MMPSTRQAARNDSDPFAVITSILGIDLGSDDDLDDEELPARSVPASAPGLSTMVDKRRRRGQTEMNRIRETMIRLTQLHRPVTIRQLFYLIVSAGVIDKTEAEYKQTVVRLCLELRESGRIDWESVVDQTRFFFKPDTFDSLQDALEETARAYRRCYWADAEVQIQVWCESLSVAGIIKPETYKWDVPLYPGKGYSSHDFLHTAGRSIAHDGRPAVVYLFGDYDPSGRDIIRFVQKMLRQYASEVHPDVVIDFEEVAVTPQQITEWGLPSHPAKKSDSRHARYGIDHAVELEAIPPDRLRGLVRDCITQHINADAYDTLKTVEAAERETLFAIAKRGAAS
jgi:hypothetical protein